MTPVEHPLLLKPLRDRDRRIFRRLRARRNIRIVDTYVSQLAELCVIENPALIRLRPEDRAAAISRFTAERLGKTSAELQGVWVYLPWQNSLIHLLPEEDFFRVRTSRNADLISPDEQLRFYDCFVGIAGLSVGGSIAVTLTLKGGARRIRIADFDRLELSNTNRILAGVHELGIPKTAIVARRIWELNPYARIEAFPGGLNAANVGRFMHGLDVVVDEMDQMAVKQLIREHARRYRIAFVSTADNGDTSVVDVERHDRERAPYFLGRLGRTSAARFRAMNKLEIIREITRLMGPENVPPRMQESLPRIGETLVSVPQLGGTALLGAAATAYCVRRIAAGLPLPSGRTIISLDRHLEPAHHRASERRKRARNTKKFAERYGL